MQVVNEKNFESDVRNSDIPVIIDCYADWCGPCKAFAPTFEAVAGDYEGKVKFVKLDVDASSGVAGELGIRSIPTVIFFKGGSEVNRRMGAVDRSGLKEFVDDCLNA